MAAKLLDKLRMKTKPLRTGASAVYPFDPDLAERFRFESRFDNEDGTPHVVLLHRVEGDVIHLPRGLCPVAVDDRRQAGAPVVFPMTPKPKENQVEVFAKTIAFLKAGESGQVCAYTGWGKTVLGYAAAAAIGRKTLVVTTKDDIFKQWIEGAETFLGLAPEQIGRIRGDVCDILDKPFVVAMVQSLSKEDRYPAWIIAGFGLVILDECHRMPADQFQRVVDMFPAKLRLGLSATPKRADGKEDLITAHVGPIRAMTEAEQMVPTVMRFSTDWKCPRVPFKDTHGNISYEQLPHTPGRTALAEKALAADHDRNGLIVDLVLKARDKGRKLIVFSTQHEHLKAVNRLLTKAHVSGHDIGWYIGAHTKAAEAKREKEKVRPILLTTYSMCSEGTDMPWFDCCILAMPRSSCTQPVGRVRRAYPDKRFPLVLDLVDDDSPIFAAYAKSRLKWYQSIGAKIEDY